MSLSESNVFLWVRYILKQGNPLKIFKTLIQLNFSCFFLYSFTNCIKNGIKGNIFGDLKQIGLWGSYGLKQGNPLQNFETTNQIVFVLYYVLLFYLMYQKCYQR